MVIATLKSFNLLTLLKKCKHILYKDFAPLLRFIIKYPYSNDIGI